MLSWYWWFVVAMVVFSIMWSIIRNRTQAYKRQTLQEQATGPKITNGQQITTPTPVYQTETLQMQYQAPDGQRPPMYAAQTTVSDIPNAALPPNASFTPYDGTTPLPVAGSSTGNAANTYPPAAQYVAPPPSYVSATAQKASYTSQSTQQNRSGHSPTHSGSSAHSPILSTGSCIAESSDNYVTVNLDAPATTEPSAPPLPVPV